ncbi:MAG TPA: hydrogenase [Thermoanaerobaculia bacterium]|nr:hydrogenase [Thermoanaerobaculia bacterium]
MNAPDRSRQLLVSGVLLFLLGLLTGIALPSLPYPRLGLSAHMTALMNSLFLVALGLLWGRLRLGPRAAALAFGLALYGAYANWAFSLLAAFLGTGKLTSIASGGRIASAGREALVGAGLVVMAVAMVVLCLLLLWGLRPGGPSRAPS